MKTGFAVRMMGCALPAVLAMGVVGCGGLSGNGTATTVAVPVTAATMSGHVYGGQAPVSGATIQLYAVGITGLKSAAVPLISATIKTDSIGDFNISGDWNCTANTAAYGTNPELYIVSTGGNPGLSGTVSNGAMAMMAALGPCSTVTSASHIYIDEVTTVASVIALAPFMADVTHVGAPVANAPGPVNAFRVANVLANMSTGLSPGSGVPANATVPSSEINTLADMVSPCVNSNGTDGTCAMLFGAAMPSGGNLPVDTVAALLDVSSNPGNNVGPLFGLALGLAPFLPALTSAPKDWTVALNFTGGGLSSPAGLALDANGNAWVANASGNSVTELSSTGSLLTGAGGYTGASSIYGAQGIAVDRSGNVWVADTLLDAVVEVSVSGGAIQTSNSFTSGGLNGPIALAIDSQNNVWVSNFDGGSVTELSSVGAVVGAGPLTANGLLQSPVGIAIDGAGNVWVADNAAWDVVEFGSNQTLLSGAGYTDGAMVAPEAIALDASGRAWIAGNGSGATSLLSANGSALPASPLTGGGLAMPAAVAIDGQGTVWVANGVASGSVSQLAFGQSVPLSPVGGLGSLNAPAAIAIDASGSVWTANAGDNSVSEIVGAAAPTVTPLSASVGP
jgi:hypothetical protein